MSVNPNTGRRECDRCGVDLRGGGVANCAIVSDLDPDRPGDIRTFEFCRDRPAEESEGAGDSGSGKVVKGCARKLVTPSMIAHYTETKETAGRG